MTDEQWHALLDRVEGAFEVIENNAEDIKDDNLPFGFVEWVVFEGPLGRIRLERRVTPRVLETKVLHAHRGGSEAVQKVYSQTERVSDLHAYRWNASAGAWDEMSAGDFL